MMLRMVFRTTTTTTTTTMHKITLLVWVALLMGQASSWWPPHTTSTLLFQKIPRIPRPHLPAVADFWRRQQAHHYQFLRLEAKTGNGGGGGGGGGDAPVNGDGGGGDTSDVKRAINFVKSSFELTKEIGSQHVDEKEAEREAEKEEIEEEKKQKQKKEEKNNNEDKEKQNKKDDSLMDASNEVDSDNKGENQSTAQPQDSQDDETISQQENGSEKEKGEEKDNAAERMLQEKLDAFKKRARRTRIVLLKKTAAWAFSICDTNESGKIDEPAFYAAILLCHLNLAKYVGVAASNPPAREQIKELFELADHDRSGTLNQDEFIDAVVVAFAPIGSRIATYWSLLVILPFLVGRVMGGATHLLRDHVHRMDPSLYKKIFAVVEWIIETAFSLTIYSILLPNLFGRIDRATRSYARRRSSQKSSLWWLRLPEVGRAESASWLQETGKAFYDWQASLFGLSSEEDAKSSKGKSKNIIGSTENDDNNDGKNERSLWRRLFRRQES